MTPFTIAAAVLAATTALLIIWPLLRPRAGPEARAHALAVYRDQLEEVERDRERGLIDDREAEAARLDVQRRLLAAGRQQGEGAPRSATRPVVALVLGLVVVGSSLALYGEVGSPHLPGQPLAQRDLRVVEERRAAMAAELAELEALAAESPPADPAFWLALGQLRTEMTGPDAAARAYQEGLERFPEHAMLRSALGESMVGQAQGTVTPAARVLFREALARSPGQPLALYYLGLAASQEGDDAEALERWGQMLWVAPEDAGWRSMVEERFREAARRAGVDADRLLAEGPRERPPVASASPPAAVADDDGERAMIDSMVAGLEARLAEQPDDLEGWLRLGRAKLVLGDMVAGRDAFARARNLAPHDARVLIAEADARLVIGERTMGIPVVTPEIADLFRRAASLDPHDPQPHWYLGLRALQQGEVDRARAAWEEALARVEPDSEDYRAVKAQIEALPEGDGG
jgi:cytochrome c-type biogenesis protein CcmH